VNWFFILKVYKNLPLLTLIWSRSSPGKKCVNNFGCINNLHFQRIIISWQFFVDNSMCSNGEWGDKNILCRANASNRATKKLLSSNWESCIYQKYSNVASWKFQWKVLRELTTAVVADGATNVCRKCFDVQSNRSNFLLFFIYVNNLPLAKKM
jgi:hypothetical protein